MFLRARKSTIQSTNRLLGKEVIGSRRRGTFGTEVVSKSTVQVQTSHGVMAVGIHYFSSVSSLIPMIVFNNKIFTSARNGELILWDLNKSGVTKYGALML